MPSPVWRTVLLLLVLFTISGCREQLMHNLSEQQANRLVTRLSDSKIDSQKKRQADGRWSVEVERTSLPEAMREMEKMRLLREVSSTPNENTSVIASREQQRFSFERALSGEIEQTLASLKGVLEARVHLNLPQVDPLFGKIVPGAQGGGSVFIIAENQLMFSREEIMGLVAGAAGIKAESVSVLIEVEPQIAQKTEESLPIENEQPYPGALLEYAQQLKEPLKQSAPILIGVLLVALGIALVRRVLMLSRPRA